MSVPVDRYPQKPAKVQTIAIITLVNGILNIIFGVSLTLMVILGTFGLGLFCAPLTILPSILGIFEVIGASKLMGNPPRKFNVQTIAIFEIISIIFGDFLGLAVGIVNLVFYNDFETKHYIDSLPS